MNLGHMLYELQRRQGPAASLLKMALSGGASMYALAMGIRESLYDHKFLASHRLPVPVVSVGNITTGGTGKTPACVWLVRKIGEWQSHFSPVLVSRGYGNDESLLLKRSLPEVEHFINSKRYLAGLEAIDRLGKEICLILDDGFQHRALQRDLDIVLIDASNPFGFGHLLPRGFLREPLSHLRRADVVVLTRCDMAEERLLLETQKALRIFTQAPQLKSIHKVAGMRPASTSPEGKWGEGKKLFAFAGIGNPQSFLLSLQKTEAEATGHLFYPDHFAYSREDLDHLFRKAKETGAEGLVTTAKDEVKLFGFGPLPLPVWVLDIQFEMYEGEGVLEERVRDLFSRRA